MTTISCCLLRHFAHSVLRGRAHHLATDVEGTLGQDPDSKKGITVPPVNMCSVVISSRLFVLASLHLKGQIHWILMPTNKQRVVLAIQKDGHMMLPYLQVRIFQVTKHKEDLAREGHKVEEVSHVRAEDNTANLGTRGLVKLSKVRSALQVAGRAKLHFAFLRAVTAERSGHHSP